MDKVDNLIKQLHLINNNPANYEPLDILDIFKHMRWELLLLEESIMKAKFNKENN
jgi:hypothetical protein